MTDGPDYLRSMTGWALFFSCLVVTLGLTPIVGRIARRLGAVDTGGHRKVFQGSMPLLGGLGLIIPFVGVCLLGWSSTSGLFADIEEMRLQFLVLAFGSVAIGVLGIVDDVRGLRARYKLIVQIVVSIAVVSAGRVLEQIYVPFVGELHISSWVAITVGVLWLVGLMNAINLIDGVDGLASGISLIAACALLALAAIGGWTFVVVITAALAGSLVGFLPYNFHPARIFLGDTGSMFLGFALAAITLMGTYKSETAVVVLAPILALGFPIFETLLSMARRFVRGVPIFAADDRHTHHRLLGRGYSQRRVVFLLYGVSGILAALAIMSRVMPQDSSLSWIVPAAGVFSLLGIVWLAGYLREVSVEEVLQSRQRTALLNAYAQYAALSLSSAADQNKMAEVLRLGLKELGLGYLSVSCQDLHVIAEGSRPASASRQYLRLNPGQRNSISIEYEFAGTPTRSERRDVATCLARLFEMARIETRAEG